jgi:hypothetical protein
MDTTQPSTTASHSVAGSVVSSSGVSPATPGTGKGLPSSVDPALHERLQRDYKRLKAKVQSLERENEALKGSLFELSVRYGAALSTKGKTREVEEDKVKEGVNWARAPGAVETSSNNGSLISNAEDNLPVSAVTQQPPTEDPEATLAPSSTPDPSTRTSPSNSSPASAHLPALDPSAAAAALLPALPQELAAASEIERPSKPSAMSQDWDTLAGVEDTEDAKELARHRERERERVIAQEKNDGWKFGRGYDLKVRQCCSPRPRDDSHCEMTKGPQGSRLCTPFLTQCETVGVRRVSWHNRLWPSGTKRGSHFGPDGAIS